MELNYVDVTDKKEQEKDAIGIPHEIDMTISMKHAADYGIDEMLKMVGDLKYMCETFFDRVQALKSKGYNTVEKNYNYNNRLHLVPKTLRIESKEEKIAREFDVKEKTRESKKREVEYAYNKWFELKTELEKM